LLRHIILLVQAVGPRDSPGALAIEIFDLCAAGFPVAARLHRHTFAVEWDHSDFTTDSADL
jgi:hypothetical protein